MQSRKQKQGGRDASYTHHGVALTQFKTYDQHHPRLNAAVYSRLLMLKRKAKEGPTLACLQPEAAHGS